jgi:ribosome-associated translation inhibitor RaiA
MQLQDKKINKLIHLESQKIKKKHPLIRKLDISYFKDTKAGWVTSLKTNALRSSIKINNTHNSYHNSIKNLFNKLDKVLTKKQLHQQKKHHIALKEALYE